MKRLAILGIATAAAAMPYAPATADGRIWKYGASTFEVEAGPAGDVTITFRKVGNGLDREGVVAGTPIFQGVGDGLHLKGESAHFRKECGIMKYDVAGLYDLAGGVIFLSGRIPARNKDCHVETTLPLIMKFEAVGTAPMASVQPPPPPREAPPAALTPPSPVAVPSVAVAPAPAAPPPPPPPVAVVARPAAETGQGAFCARVHAYAETLREWKRVDALTLSDLTAREQIAALQKRDPVYRAKTMRQFTSDARQQAAVQAVLGWSGTVASIKPDKGGLQLAVTVCPDAMRVEDDAIEDAHGYALFGALPAGRGPYETALDLKAGDAVVIDAAYDPTRHKEIGDRLSEAQQAALGARFTRLGRRAPESVPEAVPGTAKTEPPDSAPQAAPPPATSTPADATTDSSAATSQ